MCLSPEIFAHENYNKISSLTEEKHMFAGSGYVVGHLHVTTHDVPYQKGWHSN